MASETGGEEGAGQQRVVGFAVQSGQNSRATGWACDYGHGGGARERPGRGLMKPHTDTNDWARCFSSRRGIRGAGQRQGHS